MTKRILVVAAHPDDEVLGCGATLAKHSMDGDEVHILFLTDGVSARESTNIEHDRDIRRRDAKAAASILGIKSIDGLALPDNGLDKVALLDIIRPIESKIIKCKPDIIYTHHFGDLNVDHCQAYNAVLTACRPVPGFSVSEILAFETLSSTEWAGIENNKAFIPNKFINISATLDTKCEAMEAYKHELHAFPHPRSLKAIRALASLRGASVGLNAAEAFTVIRQIF